MTALKPIAKALVPLVIGFVVTILQGVAAGKVDTATVATAAVTLLTSLSVYLTPNRARLAVLSGADDPPPDLSQLS